MIFSSDVIDKAHSLIRVPPEIVLNMGGIERGIGYLQAVDIWAFGLFLSEICTGKYRPPFDKTFRVNELLEIFWNRQELPIPSECHPSMKKIIKLCLDYDVDRRIQLSSLDIIEKLLDQHYNEVASSTIHHIQPPVGRMPILQPLHSPIIQPLVGRAPTIHHIQPSIGRLPILQPLQPILPRLSTYQT
jgi:serine/threonine protein kinase